MVFELKTVEWRKKNAHIVFIKIWFKVFLLGSGIFLVEAIYNKLLRSMESNGNMAGLCFKDGCFITVRIQTLFPRSVFVGRLLDQWEESLVPLWLYIIVQSQQGSLWEQSNWDLLTWRWQRGESRCAGSWAINRCGYGWTERPEAHAGHPVTADEPDTQQSCWQAVSPSSSPVRGHLY